MYAKLVVASIFFYSCICSSQQFAEQPEQSNIPLATSMDCPEKHSSPACEEERVKKNFTVTAVERVISGKALKIPANFISAGNFGPVRNTGSEVVVAIFLPDFVGYTRDNWRNVATNNDYIWVTIKSADDRAYVEAVDDAIKSSILSNVPISRVFGFDAYLYDFGKGNTGEPIPTYVAKKPGAGDPAFVLCRQTNHVDSRCELSIIDTKNNFLIRARFAVKHAPQWLGIESRLRDLASNWVVR